MSDLVQRLWALSAYRHDDTSIGEEATDEIERLTAEVKSLDRDLGIAIDQRDQWESDATELAEAVGRHFGEDVGEHTSANCPIRTALTILDNAAPVSGSQPPPEGHESSKDCWCNPAAKEKP